MDEKHYHALADATLAHCFDRLDAAFECGTIDALDLEGGILTIIMPSGRTYLLSKHAPSRQLWYASAILGGLHFSFDDATQCWMLADGRTLYGVLQQELLGEKIEVVL